MVPWQQLLPQEIEDGRTQEKLICSGVLSRVLAAMIDEGCLVPGEPAGREVRVALLEAGTARLAGDPTRFAARQADIESRVDCHLRMIEAGARPYVGSPMSLEEMEHMEQLAQEIVSLQPPQARRAGGTERVFEVLCYIVLKCKGGPFKLGPDHAVRHLGWVEPGAPHYGHAVHREAMRLYRLLAWLTEGTEQQVKLNRPPLLRRVKKGYSVSQTGRSAPSVYEVLWHNWGGPLQSRGRRASSTNKQTGKQRDQAAQS